MSEDELEKIKLECNHSGSAKRIRAGRKHAIRQLTKEKPLWLKQLRGYKAGKSSRKLKCDMNR